MELYRRILACLDGSKESFNAYENALKLAKSLNASLTALTVIPLGVELSSALSLFLGIRDLYRKNAEKILKEAKDLATEEGLKVKLLIEEGEPFQRIVDIVYAEDIDLIFMGKSGKSGLAKGILGSTAIRTIGVSPIDVMILPKEVPLRFNRILVPVDGSAYSEKAALKALALAKHFQSKVLILSVVELILTDLYEVPGDLYKVLESLKFSAEENVRKLKAQFKMENIDCDVLVTEGAPPDKILEIAEKEEITLVVMGSHGKRGFKRLLLGSVTERVINFGNLPVLVVKS
ncbi:MAG: universal stress protein [Caldimicrobium sp.]|nr:universal stress protein [Caldimicrobium sp.]